MLTTVLKIPPSVPAASSRSASEIFIRSQDPPALPRPAPSAGVIPIASPRCPQLPAQPQQPHSQSMVVAPYPKESVDATTIESVRPPLVPTCLVFRFAQCRDTLRSNDLT